MSRGRVVPLLFCVLLLVCSGEAAEGLLLRLAVPNSTGCVSDTQITAELELRNNSSKRLIVNAAAIGTSVDALALYSTEQNAPRYGSFRIMGDSIRRQPPKSIALDPGASHRIRGTFELTDEFFREAGFYQIRTDYFANDANAPQRKLHVSSNWVIILLEHCNEVPKKK